MCVGCAQWNDAIWRWINVLNEVRAPQGHYLLGLRILNMLVAEFNQPTPGRTMTQHRKLAVAFRDHSLFSVLNMALLALRQLQASASADAKLREQARPPTKSLEAFLPKR